MKLHAGTNVVEKSGNFEESKFSIEASSKAFFILSDGLYSNKVLAVVRELSTNAYDSHVDAGKPNTPFDVHLPTALEPVFFIRDYGTSMNHDSCMQLYTTYFRSTRNNSNDAVGCLGLGSKAPFAYADSFTVEAYLNGKKRIYNAYKNEDGSPVFSLMDEIDTNEPNGIKVSIQVNSYDINRFHREAETVYQFFKVKPNFIGEKITFKNVKKVLTGDNWYFDDESGENLIIMGQIAYPLDYNQLMHDNNREAKFVQYSDGLRIFVKIGDVDITPSRESLSYSKDTKTNIKNIISSIISDISTKIEDQIKNQTSLFKARMTYVQISDQCSSIKNAVESLQKSIEWNGQKLFDNIINESVVLKDKISMDLLYKSYYRKKVTNSKNIETMIFKNNMNIVIDDLTRGGLSRIKQKMKENSNEQTYFVYRLRDNETIDSNSLYDILGGATKDDVIVTSSLPKVEYNRQSSSSGGDGLPPVHIQVFNEEKGMFEECSMSVKYENAYYFIESKESVKIDSLDIDLTYIQQALVFVHEHYPDQIDGMTFYAVKPSVAKNRNLSSRDNWYDAAPVVRNLIKDATEKHKDSIIDSFRRYNLSRTNNHRWKEVFELTKSDNNAKNIIAEYNEFVSSRTNSVECLNTVHNLSKIFKVSTINLSNINLDDDRFSKRFDAEIQKYTMLQVCHNPWRDAEKQIIADYIDNVENHTLLVNNL